MSSKMATVTIHSRQETPGTERYLVVLHYYATGPGQELHEWLAHAAHADATLLEHPFPFSRRAYARWTRCSGGQCTDECQYARARLPLPIRYALDFFRTLRLAIGAGKVYDWYIGNGAFDTLAGIVLRWLGRVRHVVLYTIDYAPGAGGSGLYAWMYRRIDRFCCRHSDVVWNLSSRMHDARLADGMSPTRCAPVVIVPHGTHAAILRAQLPAPPDPVRIGFMGHVQEKSGVHLLIQVLAGLAAEFPSAHLDILGDGPYVPALKQLAEDTGVAARVTFHGFLDDHAELERRLSLCGMGVALYTDAPGDFSRLADPGKPKVYLACGLPVIITDVPVVAGEIAARGAGIIVRFDAQDVQAAVRRIAANYTAFRTAALAMAAEYDWPAVFSRAFDHTRAALHTTL